MRSIDADELKSYLEFSLLSYIRGVIDLQETLDVVPVVHGKWMPYEDEYWDCIGIKCSKCGEIYISEYSVEEMAIDYSYCPNCGAKMDGDK